MCGRISGEKDSVKLMANSSERLTMQAPRIWSRATGKNCKPCEKQLLILGTDGVLDHGKVCPESHTVRWAQQFIIKQKWYI